MILFSRKIKKPTRNPIQWNETGIQQKTVNENAENRNVSSNSYTSWF